MLIRYIIKKIKEKIKEFDLALKDITEKEF